MVAFRLQRLSGGGSENRKNDRLRGDPRLLGLLSFADGNYLVASPVGYDSMKLQFLVPSAFVNYTRLAVVRSNYGFPVNKHDGVTVFEYPNTATPVTQTFIDTNFGHGLQPGQWYYYTLFAKMPNSIPNWNQVDIAYGVVTMNFGSGDDLWDLLPGFYRSLDATTQQKTLPYTDGGQLERFIDLFGYEVDVIRTIAETLLAVNHPELMSSLLLYLQGYDLSLPLENAIGDARYRALVTNALTIREQQGTAAGLAQYINSLTDYAVRLKPRRNIFQSSVVTVFQDTSRTTNPITGQIVIPPMDPVSTAGSISSSGFLTWVTAGVPAPTGSYANVFWAWKLALTGGGAGFVATSNIVNQSMDANGALSPANPSNVMSQAVVIPQTGVAYTYSAIGTFAQANTTASGPVQIRFVWYDANGVWISSDTHAISGSPAFSLAKPTEFWATSSVAPSNARFADAQIYFNATTAPFQFVFSGQQFELASGFVTDAYIDPHSVEIQLLAQRVNLVTNPSAEVDNTLWALLNLTSFTATSVVTATAGARVFRLVCNSSSNARMTTAPFMTINPAYIYSMRFDAMVPNTSIGINAIIIWYDGAATPNVIRTDTLNFPAPLPTTVMRGYDFGNVVPPSTAVQAKVAIEFTGVANTNQIDVDAVLFGPGPPMWYFDGDTQDGLDTPATVTPSQFSDFQWGGTQGKSASYFYNNLYIVKQRLTTDLPNWLPFGTPFSLTTNIAP